MRKFSIVSFVLLFILGLTGISINYSGCHITGGPVSAGDTAWMLTSTAFVLLMTPGLAFFTVVW